MTVEELSLSERLKELSEIGQTFVVYEDGEKRLEKMQISRALYYHGKKQGKKFGYIRQSDYFIVVLVGFR